MFYFLFFQYNMPPMGPPAGQAPPFTMPSSQPPGPPSNHALYDNARPMPGPTAPTNEIPDLPDLPSVPGNTIPGPPGGTSAGGEDVDFDDLTRRFEELKKRK